MFLLNRSVLLIRPKLHLANDGNYRWGWRAATGLNRGSGGEAWEGCGGVQGTVEEGRSLGAAAPLHCRGSCTGGA